jgi:hypothetical protein
VQPWNWNIHYHRLVLDAVRPGAETALDVGSGDGLVTFDLAVAGAVAKRAVRRRGRYWEHRAPTAWPPPHTTAEMQAIVDDQLPGARFRRLLSGQYGVTWVAPA